MATAALNWYGSLDFLSKSFRVVAPNLRGHGQQGRGAPPFSVEACADDLAALVNELSIKGAIVVGYSMGGAIAQMLARRHRDVIGGLALCATAASFARRIKLRPAVGVVGRFGGAAARKWPQTAEQFLKWQIARHDRAVERAHRRTGEHHWQHDAEGPYTTLTPAGADRTESESTGGSTGGDRRRGRPEWAFAERSLSDLAAFIEAGAALNAYDSSSWLPQLDVPAAVLVTTRDEVVAPWRQNEMASLIPGARKYVVDAGHDAVVARPGMFLPVLREACAELAKSS